MIANGRSADKNLFIVCVDDDPVILLSFRHMIHQLVPLKEVEVLTATKGNQALFLIDSVMTCSSNLIVLLISDWRMPNLYGDDLFKIIHRKYPDIRLLMISAYPEEMSKESLKGIPYRYLTKPVSTEELQDMILDMMVEAHLGK